MYLGNFPDRDTNDNDYTLTIQFTDANGQQTTLRRNGGVVRRVENHRKTKTPMQWVRMNALGSEERDACFVAPGTETVFFKVKPTDAAARPYRLQTVEEAL